jgi:hypothetical protein
VDTSDDIWVQSYYPVAVAADMAGYHPHTIEKLIRKGRVRYRRQGGRLVVHLGSLLDHQAEAQRKKGVVLREWLKGLPAARRKALTYPQLAVLASQTLGYAVSKDMIYRAFKHLRWSRRPCNPRG